MLRHGGGRLSRRRRCPRCQLKSGRCGLRGCRCGGTVPEAVLKESLLFENCLKLGHDYPIHLLQVHHRHDAFFVCPQVGLELILRLLRELAELQCKLLTLLEEYLFIHVFLS